MKKSILLACLTMLFVFFSSLALALPGDPDPDQVADNNAQAVTQAQLVFDSARTGQWFAAASGVIWLLMFGLKTARNQIELLGRIPKRVLWIIVPILSIIAMLLAKFQGDLSWVAALYVLASGPSMAFANDLIKRGILNQEPSPMKVP